MPKNLSKKTTERLWAASLIVIGGILLILFAASVLGLELPILMVRVLGIIDLLTIPLLAWTTWSRLKRFSKRSENKKK